MNSELCGRETDARLQHSGRNLFGENGYVPTRSKTDGTALGCTYKTPRQFIFAVATDC